MNNDVAPILALIYTELLTIEGLLINGNDPKIVELFNDKVKLSKKFTDQIIQNMYTEGSKDEQSV